jgi:hypothetical protein
MRIFTVCFYNTLQREREYMDIREVDYSPAGLEISYT